MSDVQPIRPDDVALAKAATIPGPVIEAFNELIAKHWNGDRATFTQDEALAIVIDKLVGAGVLHGRGPGADATVFNRRWLDVEETFRAAGWKVVYDKPGFNESYHATFAFSRK